jgi:hypothetical protein
MTIILGTTGGGGTTLGRGPKMTRGGGTYVGRGITGRLASFRRVGILRARYSLQRDCFVTIRPQQ